MFKARAAARYCIPFFSVLTLGCVRYVPRPLDPAALEQSFRARSLADPAVEEFYDKRAAVKPASWPPDALDLDGLTILALYFNPDIDEARSRIAAADAAIITAGTKPNPSVVGGAGYTDAEQSPYAFRLDLAIPFETARKREHRFRQAQQLSHAARFALAEEAWRVRSRLRAGLIDHLTVNFEIAQREAERKVQEEIVAIYDKRVEVGEAPTPLLSAARPDLARVQLEILRLRGRADQTRAAIAALIGLPGSALAATRFVFDGIEKPPEENAVGIASVQKTGLLNRLDVQRLLAEYAAAESDLHLQVARQYPDIALAPGYSFGEGSNSFVIGPGLTIPLLDRNRGPIAEAEARRAGVAARFLVAQAGAIGEMERALADYRSARIELQQANSGLDLVRDREQSARRQLDAGEADRLSLALVRLESTLAERSRLEALRHTQTALGALEDAVQHPLAGGAEMPPAPAVSPRARSETAPTARKENAGR